MVNWQAASVPPVHVPPEPEIIPAVQPWQTADKHVGAARFVSRVAEFVAEKCGLADVASDCECLSLLDEVWDHGKIRNL